MKILFVLFERKLGGGSICPITLAKELRNKGNDIYFIVPFSFGPVYETIKAEGFPVKPIFFGWWQRPSYWNPVMKLAFTTLYKLEWLAVNRMVSYATKNNIELVYSASSVIDAGAKVASKCNLPHVWHFREFGKDDYRFEYINGRSQSISYVNNSKSKVVFISNDLRVSYSDISDDISTIVYEGIPEEYQIKKDYQKHDKTVFLIAGNLARNKGQMLALKAADKLLSKGVDNFELWIAGKANSTSDSIKYENELKTYSEEHLPGIVKFQGFVSDMKALRQQTDIELVCSNREAFGRVTIEAMMAGNPVIASDSGANGELVIPDENGLLYKNNDFEDLAMKMQLIIEHNELIEKMGNAAYTYACSNFTSKKNTDRINEIFADMVSERKG